MSKKDEALKLALEALEQYEKAGLSTLKTIDAIVSLREALAEQPACEHEWLRGGCLKCGQSIEQPAQQEPVAWITQNGKGWLRWHKPEDNNTDSVPLYTSPPASKPLTDELNQIAEDLRFHGLTLVKTVTGYAVLKLGHVAAHAKGDA